MRPHDSHGGGDFGLDLEASRRRNRPATPKHSVQHNADRWPACCEKNFLSVGAQRLMDSFIALLP
jgi:hypothetical protein